MINFKTLAEFKKNIKIGAKLHTMYHHEFVRDENGKMVRDEKDKPVYTTIDRGVREVSIVQTNAFACKTQKKDGTLVDSWLQYPKASECVVVDNSKLEVYELNDNLQPWDENLNKKVKILTFSFAD